MRPVFAALLSLTLIAPATAQQVPTPQPICSFFVMMNVMRHHRHCSVDNTILRAELHQMLDLYGDYIARNGAPTQADMTTSIATVNTMALEATYDCATTDDPAVAVHDAFAEDPGRVLPTAMLHLSEDRPVVLDFDTECTAEVIS